MNFFSWLLVFKRTKVFFYCLFTCITESCCIKSIFPVAFNIPKMTLPLSYFFIFPEKIKSFNLSSSYTNLTSYQRDNCLRTVSKRVDLKINRPSLHAVKSSVSTRFQLVFPVLLCCKWPVPRGVEWSCRMIIARHIRLELLWFHARRNNSGY